MKTSLLVYCTDQTGVVPRVVYVAMPKIQLNGSGVFRKSFTAEGRDNSTTVIRFAGDINGGTLTKGTLHYAWKMSGAKCVSDGAQPVTARRT